MTESESNQESPTEATSEVTPEPPAAPPPPAPPPTFAAPPPPPPPPPAPDPPAISGPDSGPAATAHDRPEVAVGAAFAGGFLLAMMLKRLGR